MDESDDVFKDSDSDDDLLIPDFLKKTTSTVFRVLTPRKGIRPCEETLSPLPVLKDGSKPVEKSKAKISLSTLLTEKKKEDVIQKNVSNIMELKSKFDDEDYMDFIGEDMDLNNCSQLSLSQDYSQESSMDLTQEHFTFKDEDEGEENNRKNVISIAKRFVNDFPDMFPGEKYFVISTQVEDLQPIVKMLLTFAMGADEPVTDEELNDELLYTILQCLIPLKGKLPDSVCKSLWNVLCSCQDNKISQSALHILTNYVLNDEIGWVPSGKDLIEALEKFGADVNIMLPESTSESIKKNISYVKVEDEYHYQVSPNSARKSFSGRLYNFRAIIKLITASVQTHAKRYTAVDLNCVLIIAFRLTIEKIIQNALWDVKVLIGSLLDAYEDIKWAEEICNIWHIISSINMHHRNLLQLVEAIPPSHRGMEFKQMLAFNTASSLIRKNNDYHELPVKINDVYNLVSSIKITANTDYFELFSALSLVGMSINTDDLAAGQKANLVRLKDKLHVLHGEIKECKGAYLDRTKVKGVILRMVSKFKFVAQNLQTQSQLESYFEVSTKKMNVEMISSSTSNNNEPSTETEYESSCQESSEAMDTNHTDLMANVNVDDEIKIDLDETLEYQIDENDTDSPSLQIDEDSRCHCSTAPDNMTDLPVSTTININPDNFSLCKQCGKNSRKTCDISVNTHELKTLRIENNNGGNVDENIVDSKSTGFNCNISKFDGDSLVEENEKT